MTVESPLAEQQRAVVELYLHSKWIKTNLTLEDEYLFLEYENNKSDQQLLIEQINHESPISNISDNISSQKRVIKICKPENIGLGKYIKGIFS